MFLISCLLIAKLSPRLAGLVNSKWMLFQYNTIVVKLYWVGRQLVICIGMNCSNSNMSVIVMSFIYCLFKLAQLAPTLPELCTAQPQLVFMFYLTFQPCLVLLPYVHIPSQKLYNKKHKSVWKEYKSGFGRKQYLLGKASMINPPSPNNLLYLGGHVTIKQDTVKMYTFEFWCHNISAQEHQIFKILVSYPQN